MSAAKYCLGVHNFDQGAYVAGDLAAYVASLGLDITALAGAVAHIKFRDDAATPAWQSGTIPNLAPHNQTFLSEAKAAGMVTLVAYEPKNAWNFVDNAAAMAQLDLAVAAGLAAPWAANVDVWMMGNERQQHTVNNEEDWFTLENRCGQLWQAAGKLWAAGGDQAPNNLLSTIERRRDDYWATDPDWLVFHEYGAIPAHVREIRLAVENLTGRTWNIVFAEWAIDFEGLSSPTKAWVRDYRAREYAEWWGRALRKERVYGCYFTLRELLDEPGLLPVAGMADALSETPVADEPAAIDPSDAALKTRRYWLYGANERAAWNAIWKGWRVQLRHAVLGIGYWE